MRFVFLKDYFRCFVESGLGGIRGFCCRERGQRGVDELRDLGWESIERGDGLDLQGEGGGREVLGLQFVFRGGQWSQVDCTRLRIMYLCELQRGGVDVGVVKLFFIVSVLVKLYVRIGGYNLYRYGYYICVYIFLDYRYVYSVRWDRDIFIFIGDINLQSRFFVGICYMCKQIY